MLAGINRWALTYQQTGQDPGWERAPPQAGREDGKETGAPQEQRKQVPLLPVPSAELGHSCEWNLRKGRYQRYTD